MVYRYMHTVEKKAQLYSFASFRRSTSSQAVVRKRSSRVMIQGVMYAVAMVLIGVPAIIDICLAAIGSKEPYASEMIANIADLSKERLMRSSIQENCKIGTILTTMANAVATLDSQSYVTPL